LNILFWENNGFVAVVLNPYYLPISPQSYATTVTKNTGGIITGEGISCGNDCSENYLSGGQKILTITPEMGYQISSVTGCDIYSSGQCTLNINSAKNINVVFAVVPTPPLAPNGLSAIYSSKNKRVSLRWNDNSNNEIGFRLEKKEYGARTSWVQIATLGPGIINYVDSTESSVSYRVRAYNEYGNSGYSNEASVNVIRKFTDHISAYAVKLLE